MQMGFKPSLIPSVLNCQALRDGFDDACSKDDQQVLCDAKDRHRGDAFHQQAASQSEKCAVYADRSNEALHRPDGSSFLSLGAMPT